MADVPKGVKVAGYEQITGLSAVKGFTVPDGALGKANIALVQAEAQAVRWRDDGTNPTAAIGTRLVANGDFVYQGNLSKPKFIEEAASAKLNVTYYE